MVKKRKDDLTPKKTTVTTNQYSGNNLEDSDNDSIYLQEKYPNDNKYEDFISKFSINTQDKIEAGPSIKEKKTIKEKPKNLNQTRNIEKCTRCSYKFTSKTYSVMCVKCEEWFCLSCTKLSKKEVSEIKKLTLKWTCLNCEIDKEPNDKIKNLEEENKLFKNIIYQMNEKIEKLIQTMEMIKAEDIKTKINLLIEKVDNLNSNKKINEEPLYSNILKTQKPIMIKNENLPVVIIKPKKNQTSKTTKQEVQKKMNPALVNVSIKNVEDIRNGGIIIKSNTKEEIEKLKKLSDEKLKEDYIVEISKLKIPKLVIIGTRREYNDEELFEELLALNYVDKCDILKIKGIRKSKHLKKYIIYLEAIGKTFNKLVNKEISLGWDRCKVKENIDIVYCFKCCQYGHKIKDCLQKQVCSFCAGEHTYLKCKAEIAKCNNCKFSNDKYFTNYNYEHEANSEKCSIHIIKILKEKEKINYNHQ